MNKYTQDQKNQAVQMMSAPANKGVKVVSETLNIPEATLYLWRKEARIADALLPEFGKAPEQWTAAAKFGIVMEAAGLNEAELGKYCREKGLLSEQINRWRTEVMAVLASKPINAAEKAADKKRIKELERDLRRKEKALAETAALLVLSRKYETLRMDGEDA